MDFEFIDESDVEYSSRGGGSKKTKKTPSLFDTPLLDRNYWGWQDKGNGEKQLDPGTQIAVTFMKGKIRNSIKNGILLDIENEYPASRLNKEFRRELIEYQFDYLFELMSDGAIVARQNENGEWTIEKIEE